jgi:hypothetical protein
MPIEPHEDPGVAALEDEEPRLRFFRFEHLPPELQTISERFAGLARGVVINVPANEERREAVRLLLAAKDCAVRAAL